MTKVKGADALLILSSALLVASIGVPWMTLTNGLLTSAEVVSPGIIVWNAIVRTPSITAGLPFVIVSVIYIGAALSVIGLSVPAIHGAVRRDAVVSYLPGVLASAVVCGLIGLFAWGVIPTGLSLIAPYPDVNIAAGIPLALAGAILATMALAYIAIKTR